VAILALVALESLVSAAPAAEGASSRQGEPAARLLRLDPGARLGGNTQVSAVAGARIWGVPGRVNFMLGLGPRQRLVGGPGHDQLGVRGVASRVFGAAGPDLIHGAGGRDRLDGGAGSDLIYGHAGRDVIHGGPGRDLIYGGPGRDRLRGGPGRDRLVDGQGATTVRAGSGGDRVDVADGRADDRVLCAAASIARITADRGDRIGPGCHSPASRVVYRPAPAGPPARIAQAGVTGDGTNGNPYTAPCSDPRNVDCTVNSFPARALGGFWSNELVRAYECPTDHPYLLNADYAPFGTTLPSGVEVSGLGPVGVSITGIKTTQVPYPGGRTFSQAIGTLTGTGNSSATNWNGDGSAYRVILHCTSDQSRGYTMPGALPP
jgi:Ca2+-binding RTX toxin-like protein